MGTVKDCSALARLHTIFAETVNLLSQWESLCAVAGEGRTFWF